MKRFLLPAFALALAVNANATSFQANMSAEQHEAQVADGSKTFSGDMSVYMKDKTFLMIPGPTPVPESVMLEIAKHPIGPRSSEFSKILEI